MMGEGKEKRGIGMGENNGNTRPKSRLAVITSHLTQHPQFSSSMASSEKEAAVAAAPSSEEEATVTAAPSSEKETALAAAPSSEKEAALAAAPSSDSPTIFDKIINKQIPANVVYEDDKVLAFRDIGPQAPTHILIIPKVKDGLTGLSKAEERHTDILGHLLYTAKLIAKQEGLKEGFRIVINDGPSGCQSVYHLHIHLLGGRQMNWPPG